MDCLVCRAPLDGTSRFCARCGASVDAGVGVGPARSATAMAPATEAEPRFDPFIGQTIGGRYRVAKLLGEGGMGAVYVGEQHIGTTLRKVAIKTLHPHLSKDPKILTRFERECATVAELQHPNTIQLYDFGKTDDGILYMVMEFVQGESLATVLEKNRSLEPGRVYHILRQICDALGEAHTLGIVHRDLKPENIVLTERATDWVKVLDFGIAKRTEAPDKEEQKLTQQGTVLGTPPYMSPEQFTGQPIDPRSDIYSIAVIGYEMLAGRLPFTAATPWEWATKHMTVAPDMLSLTPSGMPIPETMVYAIMRSLSKDPADRFSTTRDFYEAMAAPPTSPEGLAISGGFARAPASMVGSMPRGSVPPESNLGPMASLGTTPPPAIRPPSGDYGGGHPGTPVGGTAQLPRPAGAPVISSAATPQPRAGHTQIGDPTPAAMAPYLPVQPPPYGAPALTPAPSPAYGAAPLQTTPARRGRGPTGIVIALLAVGGLLAAGGIVFALTRPPKHAGRDPNNGRGNTTDVDDAGDQPTPIDNTPHLPPLIDTSMPSLPTNGGGSGHGTNPTPNPPPNTNPANDPHSCKSARSLQAKLKREATQKNLDLFQHEWKKCQAEGGRL